MMRAKMKIVSVNKINATLEELEFSAVSKSEMYPPDGSDEDNTYAKWTPAATLKMSITNLALIGKFEVGQVFYVDFTPAG